MFGPETPISTDQQPFVVSLQVEKEGEQRRPEKCRSARMTASRGVWEQKLERVGCRMSVGEQDFRRPLASRDVQPFSHCF